MAGLSAVFGGLIGLAAFVLVANLHILVSTNIAWLEGGDPSTFYLTWATYRHAAWTLPPGMNPAYGLELATSVLYNDAIPLVALSLKPFSGYLSEPFQYFGIWLLLCFFLQGFFAWKIGEALEFAPIPRVVLTCFLVLAPTFLIRLQGHFALCAQWLVLAALYLYLRPSPKTVAYAWIVLVSVASIVQPYLLVMVGAIWVADLVKRRWLSDITSRNLLLEVGLTVALVTICLWMAGFFVIGGGRAVGGYGLYHLDLLGLFNPLGWSRILPNFPAAPNQFEGYSYLGLGVILLLVLAVPALLEGFAAPILTRRFLPLVAVLTPLTLFAITHEITLAGRPIVTLSLPEWTNQLTSTFRSSGRMFWPLYYSIVVGIVWLIVIKYGLRTGALLLIAALVIQVVDTRPGWVPFQIRFDRSGTSWTTPLKSPWWQEAAAHYKKVRSIPPTYIGLHWEEIGYYALTYGLQTDTVYFSRIDTDKLSALQETARKLERDYLFDRDTLYILGDGMPPASLRCVGDDDMLAKIDGLWVLAPGGAALARETGIASDDQPAASFLSLPDSKMVSFSIGGDGLNYLGLGWSWPEDWGIWSDGPSAALVFYLRKPETGFRFRLKSKGFPPNLTDKQHVQVFFGAHKLTEFDVDWTDREFEFVVPAALVDKAGGCYRLEFRPSEPKSPSALGMSSDGRALGVGLMSLDVSAE